MNTLFKMAVAPAVCLFCISACTTLPPKELYTDAIAANVIVDTVNSHFDVSYSIDCCMMPKKKDDFISFKIDTMLCTYRLDFSVNHGMKDILDRFFTISEMTDVQNKNNGIRYLGEATLYAYASFENTVSRLIVSSKIPNHIRFSFLLKNGEKYLLMEGFQVKTLDGQLAIDDYVDGVPFLYADIKKAYMFFDDEEKLASVRQKQLHIAAAEKAKDKSKPDEILESESAMDIDQSKPTDAETAVDEPYNAAL